MLYEIWVEGYLASGIPSPARLICKQSSTTFRRACLAAKYNNKFDGYGEFDFEKLTLFGCRLFDNPVDARRSLG